MVTSSRETIAVRVWATSPSPFPESLAAIVPAVGISPGIIAGRDDRHLRGSPVGEISVKSPILIIFQ